MEFIASAWRFMAATNHCNLNEGRALGRQADDPRRGVAAMPRQLTDATVSCARWEMPHDQDCAGGQWASRLA